jgi:hypothetical protein
MLLTVSRSNFSYDIGGYYLLDSAKTSAALRPSATLNAALGPQVRGGRRLRGHDPLDDELMSCFAR